MNRNICHGSGQLAIALLQRRTLLSARLALVALTAWSLAPCAHAETIPWVPWTFPTATTASASVPGLGPVNLSVLGPLTDTAPWTIRFDNVAFNPTIAPAVGAEHSGILGANVWSIEIDFTALSSSNGLIVGLGNFANTAPPAYPGYQLSALDTSNLPMPLTSLTQIGSSYDHTWISNGGFQFNDDVALNTGTGIFNMTVTPGLSDEHSDILLFSMPPNVGRLTISTIGPSSGDTINVLLAVPEPSTIGLLFGGLVALLAVRRGRSAEAKRRHSA
jgi:hypothetical protein